MKSDGPGHIVEQDPLEGGRGWIWAGVILLAIAVSGFVWTSRYTPIELHDSILQPISAFALLAGMASLVFGVWLWLRFRKFGHSFLETDMPVAGAPWKGLIRTTSDLSTKGNYTFTLPMRRSITVPRAGRRKPRLFGRPPAKQIIVRCDPAPASRLNSRRPATH